MVLSLSLVSQPTSRRVVQAPGEWAGIFVYLVDEMRKDYKSIGSYAALAKKYAVDWTTVKSVVLNKTRREEFRNEGIVCAGSR